jgi:plastocyanin
VSGRLLRLASVLALAASAFVVGTPSQATPAACASSCTVKADTNAGYIAPAIEVTSGADVSWLPTTTSHPTAESFGLDPCFQVAVGPSAPVVPVVFTSSATGVTATVNGESKPCASAHSIGDAAWAITYHCQLHFWMNGTVVVDR